MALRPSSRANRSADVGRKPFVAIVQEMYTEESSKKIGVQWYAPRPCLASLSLVRPDSEGAAARSKSEASLHIDSCPMLIKAASLVDKHATHRLYRPDEAVRKGSRRGTWADQGDVQDREASRLPQIVLPVAQHAIRCDENVLGHACNQPARGIIDTAPLPAARSSFFRGIPM